MYISAINSVNRIYNNNNKKKTETKQNLTFQAHPDFKRLSKNFDVTASSYFRRGRYYGSPDASFSDIVNVLNTMFGKELKAPLKMLIVGIGSSQEPFSYLTVIKELIEDKKLSEALDLHIVDLQSQPTKYKLFQDSYYEYGEMPRFGSSSFIFDRREKIRYDFMTGYYRVNNEIFNYLHSVYSNPNKSKWDSRIQDVAHLYPKNSFDIISINNTLGYIENKEERCNAIRHLHNSLKLNGIYISDPYYNSLKEANLSDSVTLLELGIYKKK